MKSFIVIKENFYKKHSRLRAEWNQLYQNPFKRPEKAFCWDYFYLPGRYTFLRAKAESVFSKKNLSSFKDSLQSWAFENYGFHEITHLGLSQYVSGCKQELHCDVPHGPLAFVYHLNSATAFTGGDTYILKDVALNFWENFTNKHSKHVESLVRSVKPKANRLIVFDSRVPHGVSELKGCNDPLKTRVVIQGWFKFPVPIIEGDISQNEIKQLIESIAASKLLLPLAKAKGIINLRFHINPKRNSQVHIVFDSLRGVDEKRLSVSKIKILKFVEQYRFNLKTKKARVTLPLVFE